MIQLSPDLNSKEAVCPKLVPGINTGLDEGQHTEAESSQEKCQEANQRIDSACAGWGYASTESSFWALFKVLVVTLGGHHLSLPLE